MKLSDYIKIQYFKLYVTILSNTEACLSSQITYTEMQKH